MSKLDQLKALGAAKHARLARRNPFEDAARGRDPQPEKPNDKAASRPKPARAPRPVSRADQAQPIAKVAASQDLPRGPRVQPVGPAGSVKAKRGRPRLGETPAKPWEALGMSERTYYRRQAEGKAK